MFSLCPSNAFQYCTNFRYYRTELLYLGLLNKQIEMGELTWLGKYLEKKSVEKVSVALKTGLGKNRLTVITLVTLLD
jgi:hypothetical protein